MSVPAEGPITGLSIHYAVLYHLSHIKEDVQKTEEDKKYQKQHEKPLQEANDQKL